MNPHNFLTEIESIEYFCDDLLKDIERQNNNALWYAEELNRLSYRAERDIATFKAQAEAALDAIRRKIESVCDSLDELAQEEEGEAAELREAIYTAKDEAVIAAAIGDERRVA